MEPELARPRPSTPGPDPRQDPASGAAPDSDWGERLIGERTGLTGFLRSLGGGADTEDLVQDVMTRALAHRGSYDATRPLGPWLRRIALRAWLDDRRRRQRHDGGASLDPADPADVAGVAHGTPSLDGRDELARWLEALSDVEREALVGFHRDGCTVRELADRIGIPAGTVKSHLHRARRKLARRLGPELRGEIDG